MCKPKTEQTALLSSGLVHGELLFMRRLAVGIAHHSATAKCNCGGWQVLALERPPFPAACRPYCPKTRTSLKVLEFRWVTSQGYSKDEFKKCWLIDGVGAI
jgi:hypothetical protein